MTPSIAWEATSRHPSGLAHLASLAGKMAAADEEQDGITFEDMVENMDDEEELPTKGDVFDADGLHHMLFSQFRDAIALGIEELKDAPLLLPASSTSKFETDMDDARWASEQRTASYTKYMNSFTKVRSVAAILQALPLHCIHIFPPYRATHLRASTRD